MNLFRTRSSVFNQLSLGLAALLGLAAHSRATPLTALNYTHSLTYPNPYDVFGYNDDSYHATGLGNPVAGDLSGGVGDLTDGLYGMSVFGGYSHWSPYVMWDGFSPTLTFDFGSAFHFDTVTFQGIVYNEAAVYSLPGVQFRTSNDGVTFGAAQNALFGEVTGNDVTYAYTVAGDAGLQGRYLEIQLQTPGRWIAISEIQFSGSEAVAGAGDAVPDSTSTAFLLLSGFGAVGLIARRRAPTVRSH